MPSTNLYAFVPRDDDARRVPKSDPMSVLAGQSSPGSQPPPNQPSVFTMPPQIQGNVLTSALGSSGIPASVIQQLAASGLNSQQILPALHQAFLLQFLSGSGGM